MLRELSVQNLAVIEDLRVDLEPGFCAWSGETGAGKSLLLSALGLLLGERGSAELIRKDANELRVTGRFELAKPALRAEAESILECQLEADELLLTRRLTRQGRSSAYVNDQPVTLATLKQLGDVLVDIHGQRETHSLLRPAYQMQQLDAFGGLDDARALYHACVQQVREDRRRLQELETDRQRRLRELSLIRFEKDELHSADLKADELRELAREREIAANAQHVMEFAQSAIARLYDEEGAFFETLGKLERDAEHWSKLDASLHEVANKLRGLAAETQELTALLRPWSEPGFADPERLADIENRYQFLRRLETKYGQSLEQLIEYRDSLAAKEKLLAGQEDDLASVQRQLESGWKHLREHGEALSKGRKKVAKKFAVAVQKELVELGMPEAQLEVEWTATPLGDDPANSDVPADGLAQIDLMLSANKGEPARPLRKVASGGELSRTMLALKTVLARHDPVGTLIFDEIDANVGGRLGDILGSKLSRLGATHQIICVTHLPQVACFARHHWTLRKQRKGQRTVTTIAPLVEAERVEELASMLRGSSRSETTRQEAAAMLASARKKW